MSWHLIRLFQCRSEAGQAEVEMLGQFLTKISKHKIERLVDAIANGAPPASVNARLRGFENRRKELELLISGTETPAPRLQPNLGEAYRQTVSSLLEVLARDDNAEARDVVRGLIDAITLMPEDGKLRVEIRGELASILAMSASGRATPSAPSAETLAQQVKMVAGTCNPLCRTQFTTLLRR